jgi:Flp pilus assembly pilin Flp
MKSAMRQKRSRRLAGKIDVMGALCGRTRIRSRRDSLQRPAAKSPLGSKSRRGRRGATAIEYCFMLSLVMVVILIAVQQLGTKVKGSFNHVDNKLTTVGL